MNFITIITFSLILCSSLSSYVNAGTSLQQRQSLKGLPGVAVVVDETSTEAQRDGLTRTQIYTALESVLKSNGIKVLTLLEEENSSLGPRPWLYVGVDAVKVRDVDRYAYNIFIELRQRVSLIPSSRSGQIQAGTWSQNFTGIVKKKNLAALTKSVEAVIKMFANDFVAMNPR